MNRENEAGRIWLLLGKKEGDNAQLRVLAGSLGVPVTEKRLVYRGYELVVGRLFGATLAGIDIGRSDPITGPWPRLVLSAGRRNEPVARYIKQESGGACRIVHLGRPWSRPEAFDLVITTPQYQVPAGPGVLEIDLPLHRIDLERGREQASRLEPEIQSLAKPRIGLLLGGDAGDFRLSGRRADKLVEGIRDRLRATGGSLLVSGSPRTPPAMLDRLEREFPGRARIYRFRPDDPSNPYAAYLLLADEFVVTADSVSMTVEALATGKPVRVFDSRIGSRREPWFLELDGWRFRPLVQRLSRKLAPRRLRRDIMRIHRALEAEGRITWLGEAKEPQPGIPDDGSLTLARVAAHTALLLDDQDAAWTARG